MRLLSYAFQFVKDIHIEITNPYSGIDELRQDYHIKNTL